MRDLGYVEGANVAFTFRFADGQVAKLPALANELVALKPAVIAVGSPAAVLETHKATRTIPIVMVTSQDPTAVGLAASLARPGGNVTGFWTEGDEALIGKQLDLLKHAVPGIARIGVMVNPDDAGDAKSLKALPAAARALGLAVRVLDVRAVVEFEPALAAAVREGLQGLHVSLSPLFYANRTQVTAIVASPATAAMRGTTGTIPIVFVAVSEPVAQGFVASLAHPGGNMTGFTHLEPTLGAKWLELLKEIAPRISRAALMFNAAAASQAALFFQSVEAAAPQFTVKAIAAPVHGLEEVEAVITRLASEPTGLIFPPDPFTVEHHKTISELANRYGLPTVSAFRLFPVDGGLASYGVYVPDLFRQAAGYVDRILKGERLANLPVQQPTIFELVINLKTAKALGLNVPPTLLARADEVIE